jgi:hypothetical protein
MFRIPNTVASWCKLTDGSETWTPGDVDFLQVPVDLQHAWLQHEPLVLASIQTQSLQHMLPYGLFFFNTATFRTEKYRVPEQDPPRIFIFGFRILESRAGCFFLKKKRSYICFRPNDGICHGTFMYKIASGTRYSEVSTLQY